MEKRIPSREELQKALLARCTREEAEKLWNAKIAVAGLGGLFPERSSQTAPI